VIAERPEQGQRQEEEKTPVELRFLFSHVAKLAAQRGN
jgi:hypothetical protein